MTFFYLHSRPWHKGDWPFYSQMFLLYMSTKSEYCKVHCEQYFIAASFEGLYGAIAPRFAGGGKAKKTGAKPLSVGSDFARGERLSVFYPSIKFINSTAIGGRFSSFKASSPSFLIWIASPCSARARAERRFKVLVKIAARVDLYRLDEYLGGRLPEAPQEALQALDIVLREQATIRQAAAQRRPSLDFRMSTEFPKYPSKRFSMHMCSLLRRCCIREALQFRRSFRVLAMSFLRLSRDVPVSRSFFHSELGTRQLGGGLVAWRGYYQSLRPTQSGLSLNLGKPRLTPLRGHTDESLLAARAPQQ
jgi:hypothetical protein